MKRIFILLFLQFMLLQNLSSQENSFWRGPERNGIFNETGLLDKWPEEGLTKLWEFKGLGTGYASVAIASGKIITAGTKNSITSLFAFDMNGDLLWKQELGTEWTKTYPGIRSTPIIRGEKGYILNGLGKLFCFHIDNGHILWSKDFIEEFDGKEIQHGYSEIFATKGDTLFCTPGGKKYNIIALNRHNGEIIWVSAGKQRASAYCNPLSINHKGRDLLITHTDSAMVALNPQNGEMLWSYTLSCKHHIHANTPIYKNGKLFLIDGFETGSAMLELDDDGMGYKILWKDTLLDETNGNAVWIGDNIYCSAETKKKFCCADAKTGEMKYYTRTYAPGTVVAADGKLYCYSYAGHLGLLEPGKDSFIEKGKMKLPKEKHIHITHPVIHDKKFYVRYANNLWVYNIAAK